MLLDQRLCEGHGDTVVQLEILDFGFEIYFVQFQNFLEASSPKTTVPSQHEWKIRFVPCPAGILRKL
jgi:hypothetical protein